jgi:hypothetical protein
LETVLDIERGSVAALVLNSNGVCASD